MRKTATHNTPFGFKPSAPWKATVLLLLIPFSSYSQKFDSRGYLKELGGLSISNNLKTVRYDNIIHHRQETTLEFSDHFEIRFDLRNRLLNGFTVKNTPGYSDFLDEDPGFVDGSFILIDSDKSILHTQIDRLHLSYFRDNWEFHLGRERINWGKSLVWNPNDLFNAYAYLDFDYEERPSTDAAYLRYSWSYASSFEAGYRFGKTLDESVIALMLRNSLGEYDIQLIGGNYFEEIALGFGWSGYLKDAGFNGEISYFHPKENFPENSGSLTASTGINYMFSNAIYLTSEILYNGGYDKSVNALTQLAQPPTASDLFIAETGYFVSASYPVSPLTNMNLGLLGSFDKAFFILIPQLSYSVSENIDLLVLAQLLKGDLFSEITETPNVLFFRFKWSY